MGFLGFGKKKDFIDLGERYRRQKEKEEEMSSESSQESTQGAFDFLGGLASSSGQTESSEEVIDVSSEPDRKRKLAKRIMDMTSRMEDLSNQIYHLQQRIEVLERKLEINRF